MTKPIYIVAILIPFCTYLFGLLLVDIDEKIYELQNGPMLVTPEFGLSYSIASLSEDSDLGAKGVYPWVVGGINISETPVTSNNVKVNFIGGRNCRFDVRVLNSSDYDESSCINLSTRELNTLLDRLTFKDPATRKAKKKEILNRIEDLNKTPATRAKVSATVNWRRLSLN